MSAGSKIAGLERAEAAISEISARLEQLQREIAGETRPDPDEQQKLEQVAGKLKTLKDSVAHRRTEMGQKRAQRQSRLRDTRARIAVLRARMEERKPVLGGRA